MRKLILASLTLFLLMVPGVFAAKSIVFITDNDLVTTACPGLDWPDEVAFCNRIQSLGYDVKVVTDSLVEANSPEFQSRISGATAIVFANLSQKYIEYNSDSNSPYGKFMANLIPYTDSKKQLSILSSTIMNVPIFIPPFYYFETPLPWKTTGENVCSSESDSFSTNRITYISNKTTNPVVIYSGGNKHHARVVEAGGGSVIAQCGSAFNSVVNVTPLQRGVFWGFNDTQYFTDEAWNLFDRAVWFVMGDDGLSVTRYAIPSKSNAGNPVWIVANITDERGQYPDNIGTTVTMDYFNGTVVSSPMTRQPSGLWLFNSSTAPASDAKATISTSEAFYKSNSPLNIYVGKMLVSIQQNNYIPSTPLEITAVADAPAPTSGSYRIRKLSTLEIIDTGPLTCTGNSCTYTTTQSMPSSGALIVEAVLSNDTDTGGVFKIIAEPPALGGTLFSNVTAYRPTQTAIVNLTATWPADWANLTITKPDKTVIPLGSMTKMSSTKFNTTYAFAAGDPNGTYNLSAMIGFQGYVANITGSIQMIAWEAATSLSKSSFLKNETVNVTLETFNAWSSIAFNYTLDIINPESNNMLSTKGNMTGNATLKTTWAIPSGAKAGTYKLKAFINDTYNRTFYKEVSFSVDELPNVTSPKFVLSPTSLNFVTPLTKKIEKVLTVENSGGGTIGSIVITPSSEIATIIFVKTALTSLTAGQKKDVSLEVNGANAKEGSYTGTLTISSDAGNKTVDIRIELIGDISALADEKLAEVSSVRDSVAALEELGKDTSDVKNSLDQAEKLFKDAKSSYAAGNYENAKSNYEQALASLQAANDKLSELEQADELEEKPQDTASLVWIMAGIVILAIIAVTAYKYKDRIMEMLGKRGGSEEGKEEYYYPPEEGGEEYRVEYY